MNPVTDKTHLRCQNRECQAITFVVEITRWYDDEGNRHTRFRTRCYQCGTPLEPGIVKEA